MFLFFFFSRSFTAFLFIFSDGTIVAVSFVLKTACCSDDCTMADYINHLTNYEDISELLGWCKNNAVFSHEVERQKRHYPCTNPTSLDIHIYEKFLK